MLEGKLIIIPALGHQNKGKSSFTGSGLFVLMSQCGNNNELALQHGGFCTMWSFVAKGLLLLRFDEVLCDNVMRECNQKVELRVSENISRIFRQIDNWPTNCVLTILEWNWYQRLGDKDKDKLKLCCYELSSFSQQQNRSFHVDYRITMNAKI